MDGRTGDSLSNVTRTICNPSTANRELCNGRPGNRIPLVEYHAEHAKVKNFLYITACMLTLGSAPLRTTASTASYSTLRAGGSLGMALPMPTVGVNERQLIETPNRSTLDIVLRTSRR